MIVARCMRMPRSIKHTAQAVSRRVTPHSEQRGLVKVESGIKGLPPTSWVPIYSVSLSTKPRCSLRGNGLLRLAAVRSFSRSHLPDAKPTKKESEKTRRGLYNVDFIGIENIDVRRLTFDENGLTLLENSSKTSVTAHTSENIN